jgi:prepilin-type N-terminal cleavage/methylation domain-containing protein
MKKKKGFTLLEVLIVFILVSLIFVVIYESFKITGEGGFLFSKKGDELSFKLELFYRLKHQLEGVLKNFGMKKENSTYILSFVTSQGEIYRGVVSANYFFKDNKIFYCENPYYSGELFKCKKEKSFLGRVQNWDIKVLYNGRWFDIKEDVREERPFIGIPEKVKVSLNDTKLVAIIRVSTKY